MTRLLVVGCGPKAVAIATKAHVLRQMGWDVPEIVIVDKAGPGANWDGKNGYTDGATILGTTPFEDVGFPYSSLIAPDVDRAMLDFSYTAYMIDIGMYAEWIDRALTPPTHAGLASYLRWVLSKLPCQPVRIGTITSLSRVDGGWLAACQSDSDVEHIRADATVVTGPGEPITFPNSEIDRSTLDHHVFNGRNFWLHMDAFQGLADARIAVVGGGETAAGVVLALIGIIAATSRIEIITPHPILFTRNENWREVMYFSKVMDWPTLTRQARIEVIKHVDRGVFSVAAKNSLDSAFNVTTRLGTVTRLAAGRGGIAVICGEADSSAAYDYVIEATGFDPFWFAGLLPPGELGDLDSLCDRIGHDLSVEHLVPKLHVPGIAGMAQGPGFPSLSCLGMLAERILMPYLRRIDQTPRPLPN